ncbi:penicillin-binding transpeptidase domain-containing protein [Thermopolyspora sp. NPDC052614]|uniref:penicillin-binding transpeptidase domain-containing protein n=1 Tax=Thermopolyspora sp. NPDC052614 TaxID=3155682 RepID=UPI003426E2C1
MPRARTIAITAVAVVVVAGAGAGGAYYLLRTQGTPQETAERFVQAWSKGDTAAMRAQLGERAPNFAPTYDRLAKDLRVKSTEVRITGVTTTGDDRAKAAYSATLAIGDAGRWTYQGSIDLKVEDRRWTVDWTPKAVHPRLDGTNRLALKTTWPERAAITDSGGGRIDQGDVGGSVQQLVGYVDKADAKDAARLGAPYKQGDPIGKAGLQATFQKRLAGTPSTAIQLVGADGKSAETLDTLKGAEGESVRTTLDMSVQAAAVNAVRDVDKPTSLVAIRPSTGEILAVVNNRGGFNRALEGGYAPGSTFKTVTAAALLAEGVAPDERVTCPKNAVIGGLKIRNSDNEAFGAISFTDSFAHSCNTTFAPLAAKHLGARKLQEAAEWFGFNQAPRIGVPAAKPNMPLASSDAELAAESFGQARITASPLVMAGVAAAVADGSWRPPTLVASPERKGTPKPLPDGVAERLRPMMRAVVTRGTAAKAGLPEGTAGKTGTAEFGTGPKLNTHAWFIGYRGNLAFAVVVEGGGGGGAVAAPVAAKFLRGLAST